MTWRSAICFKRPRVSGRWKTVAALVVASAACSAHAALVTGAVEISDGENSGHRAKGTVPGRHDLSGVVVWLSAPNLHAAQPIRARMLQKNKTFVPHVLAVPVGSTVDFPNLDPIFHNAFSNFNGQIFDVGLYPPGKSRPVVFRRPGVVHVFCNIHSMMSAVIVVLESPYYAVSDAAGHYSIPNVPPGDYHLHVFYERATSETLNKLERNVDVRSESSAIAPLEISETGYIAVPHSNKFGQPYAHDADDTYSIAQ